MRIHILGSAAGGGFPQWNCACPVCSMGWARDERAPWRTQTSLAVTADGSRFALVDASPDLREQILRTPALHPRGSGRNSPIKTVVVTSGDVDHIAGLLTLRERHAFDLCATSAVHSGLARDSVFGVLGNDLVARRVMALEEPLDTGLGLVITPFAVPGKVPLYQEGESVDIGAETEDVIGLEIWDGAARAFYVPGCASVTPSLRDRIDGADALLFDGTTFTDDEMTSQGLSSKTAARMGHLAMSGSGGSMAALAGLRIGRRIFIHLNNTNPVLIDGCPERKFVESNGWEVAFDGMYVDCTSNMDRPA